jgi:hypothetical protein
MYFRVDGLETLGRTSGIRLPDYDAITTPHLRDKQHSRR